MIEYGIERSSEGNYCIYVNIVNKPKKMTLDGTFEAILSTPGWLYLNTFNQGCTVPIPQIN